MEPNEPVSSANSEANVRPEVSHHAHSHADEHEAQPSMSAADALAMLREGKLVRDVRIVGLQLQGTFEHPVKLRNATLVNLVVDKAEFQAKVEFAHCTLDRPRFQHKTTFARDLDLGGCTLSRPVFKGVTVRGALSCDNMQTHGQLLVHECRFEGRVRFWEASLGGWVDFAHSTFVGDADFRSLHANEGFVLKECRFEGDALFRGASIAKKFDATNSRFEGLLDLSKAKLHDFVYLEGIEQGERQRFAFYNALAERILIRTDQLVGRLASEQAGEHALAAQEYAFLKRSFSSLHRFDQEDWAFYQFKVCGRKATARSWRRPWTKLTQLTDWLLLDLGCGYGTQPLRAVTASLIIILMFALIYIVDTESLYVQRFPFRDHKLDYLPNRIVVGLLTSVSVFTSGFGSLRDAASGWMNMPLILESLLGTFLWGLFIVAFSRKVIR